MSTHRLARNVLTSEAELRGVIGGTSAMNDGGPNSKIAHRLNRLTRRFIEESPFLCLATADAEGNCDVSPRGDPRGFVRILDDRTLLVPERPGNRIADSLRNILENPHVGLLFIIPGVGETFRVNGRATLTTDVELLAPSMVEEKMPLLGILVDIDACYTQCSKAFLRSDLWNPAKHMDRKALPSNGQILNELHGIDADEYDRARAERYARRERFY
ncbi:MAG: MSMEG_1061 family FMN-dependent PPOX-type flavoprotein [Labilithrix sp.]